eukprot:scaffold7658_cov140-Skeletonema_menzelii.AAC.10
MVSSTNTTLKAAALSVGAAAALGVIFLLHSRTFSKKRKQQSKANDVKKKEQERTSPDTTTTSFYNQLGISEEDLPDHIRRDIHKQRKRKSKEAMISMKTPMYDNIHMLDENREPICTISMKKAKWYIRKNIGEWTTAKEGSVLAKEKDVKCIRLLFTHNGAKETEETKKSSEKLYLRSTKQNICVCCGSDGHHIRHYIVPYAYRSLLPDDYKSHMSHDIVILCPDCHVRCERSTKKRMKRMETDLRMKMTQADAFCSPVIEDAHLYHVRSCAIALVKWKDTIPEEKVFEYETTVRSYLAECCKNETEREMILTGDEPLTKAQLQKACSVKYRVKNPRFVPGSEVVVRSLDDDRKKIEEFIVDWRKHFIAVVDPKYMPTGWRVDNPVAKDSSFVLLV